MASSRSWIYDVFISFRGVDVRRSFVSHLLKELDRKSVKTFIDTDINGSRPIASEILSAIRESRISIVVLSRNYASSTWCLDELVAIHMCHEDSGQIVMPVFYGVDPSDVRKQTGEFGENFRKVGVYRNENDRLRWRSALIEVSNRIGEVVHNWSDEAAMIEKISKDVSNNLFTPSDDFAEYVGIETHIDAVMSSKLCLESGGVRMVGILGPSGIGKTTIASALYSRISSRFDYRTFGSYKRTHEKKIADFSVKLIWVKQFLTDILGHNDKRVESLGVVKQCLKHKQVLVVLDDVDDLEVLKTLVGQTSWFGFGSRIIVITKDRELLKSHMIDSIYEVDFPSRSWKFDVFPSFSGENVRKSFLSHLLKELNRRSVNTFIDNAIDRSRPIGPELISAIRGSRISIVVFSKNYASSTWCLDELVEIYKCFMEFEQMVIPIFYKVDPSHVSDQTGKFGKAFDETCKGKTEEDKQRWKKALDEVAKMAGYDSNNWSDEATMIEEISKDMSNKLSYYPIR